MIKKKDPGLVPPAQDGKKRKDLRLKEHLLSTQHCAGPLQV